MYKGYRKIKKLTLGFNSLSKMLGEYRKYTKGIGNVRSLTEN